MKYRIIKDGTEWYYGQYKRNWFKPWITIDHLGHPTESRAKEAIEYHKGCVLRRKLEKQIKVVKEII